MQDADAVEVALAEDGDEGLCHWVEQGSWQIACGQSFESAAYFYSEPQNLWHVDCPVCLRMLKAVRTYGADDLVVEHMMAESTSTLVIKHKQASCVEMVLSLCGREKFYSRLKLGKGKLIHVLRKRNKLINCTACLKLMGKP